MMKGTVTANNVIKGKISGGEVVRGLINKFTAEQIGLGNVDNTSDMDKPVSTAQAEAIAEVQSDVDNHVADKNNPHNVTFDQIGAAPAGFGYGGQSVALKNNSLIADEDDLDNELAKIYDAMNVGETKMITFYGYPSNSDWRFFGILSKSSANNGSLVAHSAYVAGSKIIKTKFDGAWQPCEWVNPPMTLGVEYRTTERINGKAVYTTLINCGVCSNASKITTGITHVKKYAAWMGNGIALPYADAGDWFCHVSANTGYVEVWMNGFTNQQVYVQLWYSKD